MIARPHNGKPVSLDDRTSARLIVRVERGGELPEALLDRLDHSWKDLALVADQGTDWVKDPLDRLRITNPGRADEIELALSEARLVPEEDLDDPASPPADAGAKPIDFGIIGSAAFALAAYTLTFLIRGLLVAGQPCVVGGPRKALKTTLLVELAICLAAALRFLDEFEVPAAKRVLFLSGESGQATLQETARRICKARGVELEDLDNLFWGFTLPKLGDPRHVEALAEFIRANGIEVVIIDPLYLCLLSGGEAGGRRIDPANLFDVGPLLARITEAILEAGATPILAHHLRKSRDNPDAPPELEDLAYAGVQEFARQWILIGRRTPYEPGTGEHQLWISVGGSAGHSGGWALDVSEGVVDENFQGRRWETRLSLASQARQEAQQQAAAVKAERKVEADRAKDEAKLKRMAEDAGEALAKLNKLQKADGGRGQSLRQWRGALGWNSTRFNAVRDHLLASGKVEGVVVTIPFGKGSRTVDGYRLAAPPEDNRDSFSMIGTPGESPNDPDGMDDIGTAGGSPPLIGGEPRSPNQSSVPVRDDRDEMNGTPGKSPNDDPTLGQPEGGDA